MSGPGRGFAVETWVHAPVGVVALRGRLTLAGVPRAIEALRTAIEESPCRAVVCDLQDLAVPQRPALLTMLPTALRLSGGWPRSSLRLAGPGADLARRLQVMGMHRYLPVHDGLSDALAAADREGLTSYRELAMPPDPSSVVLARQVVPQWWPAPDARGRAEAELVTRELVANAVEHVGRPFTLALGFNPHHTVVAVTDPSRAHPVPCRHPSLSPGGGLRIVAGLSRAWGVRLVLPAGKTVWACMPTARGPAV